MIICLDDLSSPTKAFNQVKVFINGSWVGISENPIELFNVLKDKKCKNIINIYTSISFNYMKMEIRVCNDGGRMTRPVFRVKDNKVLITNEIIEKLKNDELDWNDLITNFKSEEAVIEYIDPDEQNHTMIAMKNKGKYLHEIHSTFDPSKNVKIRYDYCEIHPSTIFGILASCVPFPDYNQAPRNLSLIHI